jgi:glycosyltransferase involved in cell wall biosynthesis
MSTHTDLTGKPVSSGCLISVIICTYGRAAALEGLLRCLESQTYKNFEILIVDGNGETSPAKQIVDQFLARAGVSLHLEVLESKKGLTRQRNVGIDAAHGSLICFLDDDVTFEADFLEKVAGLFDQPDMQDVGGITPYDVLNYPMRITGRWKLRRLLGVIPNLEPGGVDHLGRAVPLSFLKPWNGRKEIGWLGGFCMIYRRPAIDGLRFDEVLSTYSGEDRDFSMRVGRRWRLLICGDLSIQHHYSAQGRDNDLERLRQSSFGVGRRLAQNAKGFRDYPAIARTFAGDLVVDAVAFLHRPSRENLIAIFLRVQASLAGFRSVRDERSRATVALLGKDSLEHSDSISRNP